MALISPALAECTEADPSRGGKVVFLPENCGSDAGRREDAALTLGRVYHLDPKPSNLVLACHSGEVVRN